MLKLCKWSICCAGSSGANLLKVELYNEPISGTLRGPQEDVRLYTVTNFN